MLKPNSSKFLQPVLHAVNHSENLQNEFDGHEKHIIAYVKTW